MDLSQPPPPDLMARLRDALPDRYVLQARIGEGGMATVFRARDDRLGRSVAIKVLRPDIADRLAADRFLREIRVASSLTHPNILPIHDSGAADGLLYYTMPYVEGPTLREVLADTGPLPASRVREIGIELCDALDHAHRAGLVHRDVKPGNILLVAGHAVLADFGIARALDEAGGAPLTRQGVVLGTPLYMSPEQALGSETLDGRSDLYALACVLYEALVGEPAFDGPTIEAILSRKLGGGDVPALSVTRQSPLRQAIGRALAPSPDDRPSTAAEFAAGLRGERRPDRPWGRAAILATMLVLGVAALRFAGAGSGEPAAPPRVVVATLANRTGVAELDDVGALASDWVTQGLLGAGISVVPTTTVRQAEAWLRERGPERPGGGSLAEETEADIVVQGALYRLADSVRLQIQVSDARTDRVIAALEPMVGPLSDPRAVLAETRSRIMSLLDAAVRGIPDLTPHIAARPPLYEAYRAFDRGLTHYARGEYQAAIPEFREAFRRDTSFVQARLMAALNASNLGDYATADSILRQVDRQRHRLSAYDRSWLDYRRSLLAGDRRAALDAIARAAELTPYSKASYNYAVEALENGRYRTALDALDQLEPDQGPMRGSVAYLVTRSDVLHLLGRHGDALEEAVRARRRFPEHPWPRVAQILAQAALGRTDAVRASLDEFAAVAPRSGPWTAGNVVRQAVDELSRHAPTAGAGREIAVAWLDKLSPGSPQAAELLLRLGRWRELAQATAGPAWQGPDELRRKTLAAIAAAHLGELDAAAAVRADLKQVDEPYLFGRQYSEAAAVAVALGELDGAIADLRRAIDGGLPRGLRLHQAAGFRPLWDDPRFRALTGGT